MYRRGIWLVANAQTMIFIAPFSTQFWRGPNGYWDQQYSHHWFFVASLHPPGRAKAALQ